MAKRIKEKPTLQLRDHQVEWEDGTEKLILYADIMGFKERVMATEHEILRKSLLDFKNKFKRKIRRLHVKEECLRYVQFSDSVIIVVNGVDDKMLKIITKAAICLFHSAMSNGFPLKGVISKGKFTFDRENELYLGRPLVDAYMLHDEIYYYGIVVHHSLESLVKEYSSLGLPYCKGKIPLKKGTTAHYHLSWQYFDDNLSTGDISTKADKWLSKIEETVSGTPRIYIDNTRNVIANDKFPQKQVLSENMPTNESII